MSASTAGGPLVYAGPVPVAASGAVELVGDWEAAPRRLLALLDEAPSLVLLDPLSFPYEALRAEDREVPVAVALPAHLGRSAVEALLGGPLLVHLGPGDRVAAGDRLWDHLRRSRQWPPEMRLEVDPADVRAVLEAALCPGVLGLRVDKAEGRRMAAALAHLVAGARQPGVELRLLDVGGAAAAWRHLLPSGLELMEAPAAAPLPVGDESVDVCAALRVLGGIEAGLRPGLVSEMWRVTRVGGRLAVVDEVVGVPGTPRSCPFTRQGLPRLLLAQSGRRVVLDRVWSVRFPGEVLHRAAGISVTKTGLVQRW